MTDINTQLATTPATTNGRPLPVLTDVIMIVLISALVSLALLTFVGPGQQQPAQKIAYVQFQQLMNEYVTQLGDDVVSGATTVADMPVKSGQFTQELLKRLKSQADAGVTVLKSESVVAASDGVIDITDQIRSDLIGAGYLRKDDSKPKTAVSR